MIKAKEQTKEVLSTKTKLYDYSLCRASCSVCPYHTGLLKLLDHGVAIVPTLPEHSN